MMKKNLLILTILMASAGAYTVYEGRHAAPKSEEHAPAENISLGMAQDFSYEDLKGKKRTLKDYDGKAVILNFWASWCAPCVIEFPHMVKLARDNTDTIFLFLSWDEEKKEAQRFIAKYGKDLPKNVIIGFDKDRSIGATYGTKQIPETYLIDPDLQIRGKIVGADVDWTGPVIRERLSRLQ